MDMTPASQLDGVYEERNNIALLLALVVNDKCAQEGKDNACGWYRDDNPAMKGFSRIISLMHGRFTYHVPDNMDLGRLPIIRPNWDGHTTGEKYERIKAFAGISSLASSYSAVAARHKND